MKYHISQSKKTAIAVKKAISRAARDGSPVFDPENKNRHDPENQKLLDFMDKFGPPQFKSEVEMYLLLHPKYIEDNGMLPDYLLLVDKARGLKRDGYDAFTRREESDRVEKRRERRERWTLRIAFLALIASAFEETVIKVVTKFLLGE